MWSLTLRAKGEGPRPRGGEKRRGWLWNHVGFPPLLWSAWSLSFPLYETGVIIVSPLEWLWAFKQMALLGVRWAGHLRGAQ